MILCIDVGNSVIHFGVYLKDKDQLVCQFRYNTVSSISSDQFGIFIKQVLAENDVDMHNIKHIIIASVVPELDYPIRAAIIKYMQITPLFLTIGVKTGIKIKYASPVEIGADRIAAAVGAEYLHPGKNLIIVDMGTATTICAINKEKEYLAGAILAGMKTSIRALYSNTAKLPSVDIIKPEARLGKSTRENIQLGLFYGHLGAIQEISGFLSCQAFGKQNYSIVATGGLSRVYKDEKLFHYIVPDLTLIGLKVILKKNLEN